MKTLKQVLSVLCAGVLCLTLVGCGGAKSDRILYRSGLDGYVTLGKYTGLEVDTASEDFAAFYESEMLSDVSANGLYEKLDAGEVAKRDIANIDYVGTRDGVAFDGGTASGHDLEIGSGSFIDGFEDGLIGKAIGETVDLDLTFPENYQNEGLAGAAVVFTVTINSVKRPLKPQVSYSQMGYDSFDDYDAELTTRAVRAYLSDKAVSNAKISGYPKSDAATLSDAYEKMQDTSYQQQYGTDLETVLSYSGMTLESFREQLLQYVVHPLMDQQMVFYAILDEKEFKITQEDFDAQLNRVLKEIGSDSVTEQDVLDFYGDFYIEALAVEQKVGDFLYQKAVIR